jgi:putative transposase
MAPCGQGGPQGRLAGQRQAVRRLWRDEGLRVPTKKRKKRLTGIGTHVDAMCPIHPNALWALDFQFDVTADRPHTEDAERDRRVHPRSPGDRGRPIDRRRRRRRRLGPARHRSRRRTRVRFDNEFVAYAVADWCRFNGCDSVFIDPGSPWQNAWIESFNGRFRDELLDLWQFDSLLEARVIIEDWRIDYNVNRPHTAHGELSPSEFAAEWTINQPQAA